MGFVTNESLEAIHDAAGEPVLTVLLPYSPIPDTGCTIVVRKSECIDLNMTFDQACQFIVSCGVVVPPQQLPHVKAGRASSQRRQRQCELELTKPQACSEFLIRQSTDPIMPLRLGTRASALARWQAEWVAAQLRQRGIEVELTPIATTGDRRHGAIEAIGGQGVFTKEIQLALLDGRIDLAVHSLKDLPTAATPGLCLAAVPERGRRATFWFRHALSRSTRCPAGPAIGTGSLRRRAQLLHFRRDLQMKDIRGNVDTRLRKLREGGYDALVLAEAGLRRLGLARQITQACRWKSSCRRRAKGRWRWRPAPTTRHPPHRGPTRPSAHARRRAAERAMLAALQGGCLAPVAALGRVEGDRLTLIGRVVGLDGARMLEARRNGHGGRGPEPGTSRGRCIVGGGRAS